MAASGTRSGTEPGDGIDEIGVVLGPDDPHGGLFERTGTENTGTDDTGTATSAVDTTSVGFAEPPPAAPPTGSPAETTSGDATSSDFSGPETTSGRISSRHATGLLAPGSSGRATRAGPRRRTALLAWIAADLPNPRPTRQAHDGDATEAPRRADHPGALTAAAALAKLIAEESLDPLPALDGWLSRAPASEPQAASPVAERPPAQPTPRSPPPAAHDAFPSRLAALLTTLLGAALAAYLLRS